MFIYYCAYVCAFFPFNVLFSVEFDVCLSTKYYCVHVEPMVPGTMIVCVFDALHFSFVDNFFFCLLLCCCLLMFFCTILSLNIIFISFELCMSRMGFYIHRHENTMQKRNSNNIEDAIDRQ